MIKRTLHGTCSSEILILFSSGMNNISLIQQSLLSLEGKTHISSPPSNTLSIFVDVCIPHILFVHFHMILTFFTDCDLEEIAVISVGKPPCSGISLHTLTLLVNQTFILILSVSKSQPPEAKACFALNFPTAVVPLLVPSSLLVQVKRCHNLVFSLFSSGTACILNEINYSVFQSCTARK